MILESFFKDQYIVYEISQTIIVFLSELDLYCHGRQVAKKFDELLNSSQSFYYENSL